MSKSQFIFLVIFLIFGLSVPAQDNAAEQPLTVFDRKSDISFFSEIVPPRIKMTNKFVVAHTERLKHAVKNNDNNAIALSANNLGYYALKTGDVASAIKYFQQALSAYTVLNRPEAISLAQAQLAFALDQAGRDDEALTYYREAARSFETQSKARPLPYINALQGIIYLQKNDTLTSRALIDKALQQLSVMNETTARNKLITRIGEIYLERNNYSKAINNFSSQLKNARGRNDETALALRNIGITYFKKGDFETAVDYFSRSLAIKDNVLVKKLLQDCYLKIVTVSSFKKDFDTADKYHELYRTLKKEISQMKPASDNEQEQLAEKEKIIRLLSMQTEAQDKILTKQDYELSQQLTATQIERQSKERALEELNLTEEQKRQKELELEKVSAEKARQEAMLSKQELMLNRQKEYRNIFLFLSGLVLLGVLWLYNRYQIKKRSLKELNAAHERLNHAHEQLKQTQEQLVRAEKMASLGQLTAGIAHEIQNPLNFVNNFSSLSMDLLQEYEQEKDPETLSDLKINLGKINHHGNRISSIVKGMLLHSRSDKHEMEAADINELLDDSLALAYHGKRSSEVNFYCKLQKNFDNTLPLIPVIGQDLRRVFINIINNGFYAVQEKYELLKNENKLLDFVPMLSVATVLMNDHVLITITDNGNGIPQSIKEKVFNPFFTSKPTGKGTGLGLSVSYDIIAKTHGGTLNFDSRPGLSTTFTITLPLKHVDAVTQPLQQKKPANA